MYLTFNIKSLMRNPPYSRRKKAQHPVGLFRIWILDLIPV